VEAFWGRGNGNNSSSNSVANRTWRSADFFFALPCSYVSLFFRYIVAPFRAHFLNFLASQKMFIALCGFSLLQPVSLTALATLAAGKTFMGALRVEMTRSRGHLKSCHK